MAAAVAKALVWLALTSILYGCYPFLPSQGGGQTDFEPPREIDPRDVALPEGYRIEVVASGLTFPTDLAFDAEGTPYVVEAGYSYGEAITTPRLLRLGPEGEATVVAEGDNPPWNGVDAFDGAFYVAGGVFQGGRILRITPEGEITTVVEGLPSFGDHHTNGPAIGPDGWIYFGQGTATNSGVVGPDNAAFGWLYRHPDRHDVPCQDLTLAGVDYESDDPLDEDAARVRTGAFRPFGAPSEAGQVVEGQVPCSGAILRVPAEGGDVELVASGLRNPFGLAWSPDDALYAVENSYDVRGSRPVWGTGDPLWRIEEGTWYGWPDFHAGRPLTEEQYAPPGQAPPEFVLREHPQQPPSPVALLGVHSSSNGMDFAPDGGPFGFPGQVFIAQFGDMAPGVGKVVGPVGFRVVRVDPDTGVSHDFAINRDGEGPASRVGGRGLERPVSVTFDPDGEALYVVDFGVMLVEEQPVPMENTGVIWRIVPTGGG